MAATATGTNQVVPVGVGGGPRPKNGNGFHGNGGGRGGDDPSFRFSPARYRIGVWMASDNVLLPAFRVAAWPQHYSVKEHHYALHRATRLSPAHGSA